MKKVENAIKLLQPKEDAELKKLLNNNKEAINNFVRVSDNILNSSSDQKEAIESVSKIAVELGSIMKGIDTRLSELEKRPLPVKLQAVRNNYNNEIDYVIIEYK